MVTDYRLQQLEELEDVIKDAKAQRAAVAKATLELKQEKQLRIELEQRVAELEARLLESVQSFPSVSDKHEQLNDVSTSLPVAGNAFLSIKSGSDGLKNAETWEEVAEIVNCDRDCLLSIAKTWIPEERKFLPQLLSGFLERIPNALDHVSWVSEKLLIASLEKLTFTVQKIADEPKNLVDEPEIECIEGCRFISLEHLGTRREKWIFASHDERVFPVFGRENFKIERF